MATWESIENVNRVLNPVDVKGKGYIEVNQRVKAFRMIYPEGAIVTEIIDCANGVVTMKATAIDNEGKILATGFANEKESASFINKTSYIENCETSAVGRALGFCGFGIDTSICSADELNNALEQQKAKPINKRVAEEKKKAEKGRKQPSAMRDEMEEITMRIATDHGINLDELLQKKGKASLEELTDKELSDFMEWLSKKVQK